MSTEVFLNGRVTLHGGDCLAVMDTLDENSIDACLCDPPYHLQSIVKRFAKTGRTDKTRTSSGPHQRTANGFMNKIWDGGDIAFQVSTWEKVYRVLKPGAYIIAFSSSRTFGRMSVAIEDAGFITHPLIGWVFGQGFPKAHRVHIDGMEGWRYGGRREEEYQTDIRRRMALCMSGPDERKRESIKAKTQDQPEDHGPLFSTPNDPPQAA